MSDDDTHIEMSGQRSPHGQGIAEDLAGEKLTPERAVQVLRAKAGELEAIVLAHANPPEGYPQALDFVRADIALIAQLLADHIEATTPFEMSLATQQRLDPHANEHIIDLHDGGWLIQHPLSERLDGSLLDCKVTWAWAEEDSDTYGRFVLVWDEEADEWVLGEKL